MRRMRSIRELMYLRDHLTSIICWRQVLRARGERLWRCPAIKLAHAPESIAKAVVIAAPAVLVEAVILLRVFPLGKDEVVDRDCGPPPSGLDFFFRSIRQ